MSGRASKEARTLPEPQIAMRGVGDVHAANDVWGATCGPAAIAAALGKNINDVRQAVSPAGRFKGYMGVRDFREAIPRAGGRIVRAWSRPEKGALKTDGEPVIVLLRWLGPWDGLPRVRATKRHAFCYRHGYFGPLTHFRQDEHGPGWVFDANNWLLNNAGQPRWLPWQVWSDRIVPELVPKRGTGEWAIDWMAQVQVES